MEIVNMNLINIYLYSWGANNISESIMEIGYMKLQRTITKYVDLKLQFASLPTDCLFSE